MAESSPKAFVDELPFGSVVDEAQVVPAIQMQLKQLVDADSSPGRDREDGSAYWYDEITNTVVIKNPNGEGTAYRPEEDQ